MWPPFYASCARAAACLAVKLKYYSDTVKLVETTVKQRKQDRHSLRRARTRRAILDAASRLFAERGYTATTMEAIAEAADVAVETVYVRFGSKRNLLAAYLDVSVVGDDEPVPLLEREPVRAIAAETDQRRQIRLLAHLARTILESADPAQRVLAGAAAADRALEELVATDDQRRRITHLAFIEMLARNGPLRDGLSIEDAVDTYSALSNPGTYAFLTRRRGWPADRFEGWIADCFERLLLPDRPGRPGDPATASPASTASPVLRTGQR
jgi:AcrR family transcriptional regulator